MTLQISLLVSLVALANAVDVTFYMGEQCSSKPIYGGEIKSEIPCYRLDKHLDVVPGNSTSVVNIIQGQTVTFYTDTACGDEIYTTSSDACYEHQQFKIASFKVVQSAEKTTALSTTTSSNDFAMTNYHDDVVMPGTFALKGSTIVIGGAVLTAIGAAGSFTSQLVGCVTTEGQTISITTCALGAASSALAFIGSGVIAGGATVFRYRASHAMGNIQDFKKRHTIDAIGAVNEDYMEFLVNRTGRGASHIGYMHRDLGNGILQRSPVWHVPNENGTDHHVSAFYDQRSGDFIHSLLMSGDSSMEKRQVVPNYNDVMWNSGGIDVKICRYNDDADKSVFRKDNNVLYTEIYNDLSCLISPDQISVADGFAVTMNNNANVMLAQVFMTTFAEGAATSVEQAGTCGKIANTPFDQTCVF